MNGQGFISQIRPEHKDRVPGAGLRWSDIGIFRGNRWVPAKNRSAHPRMPSVTIRSEVGAVTITQLIPNPDDLLALETEELAGVLLEHLNAMFPHDPTPNANIDQPHRHNFFNGLRNYPPY